MTAPLNHPVPLLELDVMRTFVAIAETGSFTAAANAVFRTPSAVSMQIKKLEEQIGRAVFLRDARSVSLTADGEMLLGYARRLLAINREAVSKFIAPSIAGVVRLGSPDDYGEQVLPGILRRFAQTHPSIAVDVTIDLSTNLLKRMNDKQLDLSLVNFCNNTPPDVEILLTDTLVWGGARGGSAHLREPLPLSLWEEGCSWRANTLEVLGKEGRDYRIAYMSAHTAGQKAAILSDLAIAPLPRSFIGDDIVALGEKDGLPPLASYHLGLIVAPDASAPVRAAADHIRAIFDSFRETGKFQG
jgi:DNA-binding transcriptional LysR family regulator